MIQTRTLTATVDPDQGLNTLEGHFSKTILYTMDSSFHLGVRLSLKIMKSKILPKLSNFERYEALFYQTGTYHIGLSCVSSFLGF
jgi:hypothetical protein